MIVAHRLLIQIGYDDVGIVDVDVHILWVASRG
jgi:hypothetical protein